MENYEEKLEEIVKQIGRWKPVVGSLTSMVRELVNTCLVQEYELDHTLIDLSNAQKRIAELESERAKYASEADRQYGWAVKHLSESVRLRKQRDEAVDLLKHGNGFTHNWAIRRLALLAEIAKEASDE